VVPEAPLERTDAGLVIDGECLLLIEGEERKIKAWDFVHCPRWTEHVFVGAGEAPCLILSVDTRQEAHGGKTAYAQSARHVETPYRKGWLPEH
jgi:quercetin dioxygenase-like cupin family protein